MRMWANNSRGQKSHAGLMFLEYSVVFGLILNLIATIDFKDFYLRRVSSVSGEPRIFGCFSFACRTFAAGPPPRLRICLTAARLPVLQRDLLLMG